MSLSELWSTSRVQLEGKQARQIIAFAGAGQLSDGAPTASEFREFLGLVPSDYLARYADECLNESFPGSGFALQDVVNQTGKRLGYSVVDGRYRGSTNQVEGALAEAHRACPEKASLLPEDIRYFRRRTDEMPVAVQVSAEKEIEGLPSEIWA